MSGSRFSGIAVAAANRKALERQEREDALRSSITAPKQLSHKEEALLAQLRAQLLGRGGGGEGEKKSTKKPAKAPAPAAPREDVRRYDDIEDIEADDDEEEDRHEEDQKPKVTAPHEKKYMSHADEERRNNNRRRAAEVRVRVRVRRASPRSLCRSVRVVLRRRKEEGEGGRRTNTGTQEVTRRRRPKIEARRLAKEPPWPPRPRVELYHLSRVQKH